MRRLAHILLLLAVTTGLSCSGQQTRKKSKVERPQEANTRTAQPTTRACPSYSPRSRVESAEFDTRTRLEGSFTTAAANDVAVGLQGCGDQHAFALFDESGTLVAYSPFDLESCSVVAGNDGIDRLACLDTTTSGDTDEVVTRLRLLDFAKAGPSNYDHVLHRFVDRTKSCPSGKVTVRDEFSLESSRDETSLVFRSATVQVPAGQHYCEWKKSNDIRFERQVIQLEIRTKLDVDEPPALKTSPKENTDGARAGTKVVESGMAGIQGCYEDLLRLEVVGGTLVAGIAIAPDGSVDDIRVTSEELPVGFRHCMANRFRNLDFVEAGLGHVFIKKVFVFQTGE